MWKDARPVEETCVRRQDLLRIMWKEARSVGKSKTKWWGTCLRKECERTLYMFRKINREQGVQVSKIEELVCRSVILCSQLAKCVNTKHLTFIESAVLCFCDFTYLTTCMLSYGGLCSLANRNPCSPWPELCQILVLPQCFMCLTCGHVRLLLCLHCILKQPMLMSCWLSLWI